MQLNILPYIFIFFLAFATCAPDSADKPPTANRIQHLDNQEIKSKSVHYLIDETADATACFIAGEKPKNLFSNLVNEPFFAEHQKIVEQAWQKTEHENLKPIRDWLQEKPLISTSADTLTLFYPFSGPDFLYAHAFYPDCRNYIMVGLEKAGKLPDLNAISPALLKQYLESIRHSLRYMNKVGYFVTSQMRRDFSQENLDGTIHIILFYLIRTGHRISSISTTYIDSYGKPCSQPDNSVKRKKIKGLQIDFTSEKGSKMQSIYYFPLDLSDDNLAKQNAFLFFLNNFGAKITYLKSASYILHTNEFSSIRNLILNQSSKILQDDTGIPYRFFTNGKFDLQLYGNYSKTIRQFNYQYQADLKHALDSQEKDHLPFKLGYNAWYNETVLLYAKQVSPELLAARHIKKASTKNASKNLIHNEIDTIPARGLVYRIQLASSNTLLSSLNSTHDKLPRLSYYRQGDLYKYTIGNETGLQKCTKLLVLARNNGFKDAFKIALHNGKRISMDEAKKINK